MTEQEKTLLAKLVLVYVKESRKKHKMVKQLENIINSQNGLGDVFYPMEDAIGDLLGMPKDEGMTLLLQADELREQGCDSEAKKLLQKDVACRDNFKDDFYDMEPTLKAAKEFVAEWLQAAIDYKQSKPKQAKKKKKNKKR